MPRDALLPALAAILLWSTLAVLGDLVSAQPLLLVTGLGLCLGGLLSVRRWPEWKVGYATRLVGVGGILGYHLLYFAAFRQVPPAERPMVNLLNYLWPLFIVLLAPLVLGDRRLGARQAVGAGLGLAGTAAALIGPGMPWSTSHLAGYALAVAAALTWALYSLLCRRLPPFSTAAVGGFCLVAGAGALAVHAAVDQRGLWRGIVGLGWQGGLTVLAIGLGPLGAAFFCWDRALKRGDPRALGALAYLTPLLSTALLLPISGRMLRWSDLAALLLIVGGAALAAWPVAETKRTTRGRTTTHGGRS